MIFFIIVIKFWHIFVQPPYVVYYSLKWMYVQRTYVVLQKVELFQKMQFNNRSYS